MNMAHYGVPQHIRGTKPHVLIVRFVVWTIEIIPAYNYDLSYNVTILICGTNKIFDKKKNVIIETKNIIFSFLPHFACKPVMAKFSHISHTFSKIAISNK